jgi:cobalamin synthase
VTPDGDDRPGAQRRETEAEQADRNFNELLQELRVSQMGVQILFAFLLTLAFQSRFTQIDTLQRWTYVITLLLCAGATALLIAPVSLHRRMFRRGRKREVVENAAKLAKGGLLLLFLAVVGAILFIFDVVLARGLAIALTVVVGAVFVVFWYLLPWRLLRRSQPPGQH